MRSGFKLSEAVVRAEAQRLIAENGEKALEIARRAARRERDKRNHALARKYALVANYIAERINPSAIPPKMERAPGTAK